MRKLSRLCGTAQAGAATGRCARCSRRRCRWSGTKSARRFCQRARPSLPATVLPGTFSLLCPRSAHEGGPSGPSFGAFGAWPLCCCIGIAECCSAPEPGPYLSDEVTGPCRSTWLLEGVRVGHAAICRASSSYAQCRTSMTLLSCRSEYQPIIRNCYIKEQGGRFAFELRRKRGAGAVPRVHTRQAHCLQRRLRCRAQSRSRRRRSDSAAPPQTPLPAVAPKRFAVP